MIGHLSAQNRALVWLLAETGLRPGEACNLPWKHVEADNGCIRVEGFGEWRPKTDASHRLVWPSRELMSALVALPRRGEYVFPGKDPRKPIRNVRAALATAARRSGLRKDGRTVRLSLKLFRKAFASWHAERGIHPGVLQSMLGHAAGSKVTEQHYVFAGEAAKRSLGIALPVATPQAAE